MDKNNVDIKLLAGGVGGVTVTHATLTKISESIEKIINKYPDRKGCSVQIFVSLITDDCASSIDYYSITYRGTGGHEEIQLDEELNEVVRE